MKIKFLLLAAVCALTASAQTTLTGPAEPTLIKAGGEPVAVILDLKFAEGCTNMTNIQFNVTFPEGIVPATVEDEYCWPGEGIPTKKGSPVIAFSTNCDKAANWPTFTYVGANMTLTKCENEKGIVEIYMKANEDAKSGEVVVKTSGLKYTNYEGASFANADPVDAFVLKIEGKSAVEDVNADKAVASVKYYNVAGVESNVAFDGINMVVTKYVDGTTKTVKVVK